LKSFLHFLERENLEWRRTSGATPPEEIVKQQGGFVTCPLDPRNHHADNQEYIQNLISMGMKVSWNTSNWTLLITGVSRAFTHQLVRHRVGFAFSQLSQQYHDEQDATFVVPAFLEKFPEALKAWQQTIEATRTGYARIVASLDSQSESDDITKKELRRAVRSAARSVLPNATDDQNRCHCECSRLAAFHEDSRGNSRRH
jgi:thymidylate synthase (FAD)